MVERRIHPIATEAFSLDEFRAFSHQQEFSVFGRAMSVAPTAAQSARVENYALKLWGESAIVDPGRDHWGDWNGVLAGTPCAKKWCNRLLHLDEAPSSSCRDQSFRKSVAQRRSRSAGELTRDGDAVSCRTSHRHPQGHPTASGLGWVAAS